MILNVYILITRLLFVTTYLKFDLYE